jgi:hypothetical protein
MRQLFLGWPLRPLSDNPSQTDALNRPALRLLLGPDVVLHGGGDVLVAGEDMEGLDVHVGGVGDEVGQERPPEAVDV